MTLNLTFILFPWSQNCRNFAVFPPAYIPDPERDDASSLFRCHWDGLLKEVNPLEADAVICKWICDLYWWASVPAWSYRKVSMALLKFSCRKVPWKWGQAKGLPSCHATENLQGLSLSHLDLELCLSRVAFLFCSLSSKEMPNSGG